MIMPKLAYPYGPPVARGRIKLQPQDFFVDEILPFALSGSGEHLYLQVEKTDLTTHQLIDAIASDMGLRANQIGYSGLKDKRAVTRQWLSLHLPGKSATPIPEGGHNYRVLAGDWHDRKLKIGSHRHNDFIVVVRDLEGLAVDIEQRIAQINIGGFANYFAEQRFGAQADNVAQALRSLSSAHKSKRLNRRRKSLYLSALRSELFNRIVDKRIQNGIWNEPVDGDLFMLNGSQSLFSEEIDQALIERYTRQDIHCACALYGAGEQRVHGLAAQLERQVFDAAADMLEILQREKLKVSYRSNRALTDDLQLRFLQSDVLEIRTRLARGTYFTAFLDHWLDYR